MICFCELADGCDSDRQLYNTIGRAVRLITVILAMLIGYNHRGWQTYFSTLVVKYRKDGGDGCSSGNRDRMVEIDG